MSILTRERLRSFATPAQKSLAENRVKAYSQSTAVSIFLSHSHKDKELAEEIKTVLGSQGVDVYIDWQDDNLPSKATAETARTIKNRIKQNQLFLLVLTQNSLESSWVNWELGVADQAKTLNRILVLPIKHTSYAEIGTAYLQLYHHVRDLDGVFKVSAPGYTATGVKLGAFLRAA